MAISEKQNAKSWEKLQEIPEIHNAIDYGIDISMLIDNVNRSPAERIRRHQNALDAVIKLSKAKHK